MPKQPKLKIGIVLDSTLDVEDGVQQYVMVMGEWLRTRGHDVHYLVGQTEKRQLPNIHSLSRNFVVKFNGNRINLPLWGHRKKIRELLRAHHFDVLYVQTPFHPLMAQRVVLAASKDTAIVGSFNILPHSKFVAYANKALRLLLLPSLRKFDGMVATSPPAARYATWTMGLDAKVSPNVFRYDDFHDAAPFERYEGQPVIMFLGRLVPRKGCQYLLQAVNILKQQPGVPDFRVVICGKGPMRQRLETYARKAGLADIVEFTGFVSDEDKPKYYASSTVTVFPSSGGESFGIVLLEGMASGKAAVLAGDNPGYRSVMGPEPALLFNAKDAVGLAEKFAQLLGDEQKRRQFAAWGEKYSAKFDVNVVGKELESLFYRLHAAKKLR